MYPVKNIVKSSEIPQKIAYVKKDGLYVCKISRLYLAY